MVESFEAAPVLKSDTSHTLADEAFQHSVVQAAIPRNVSQSYTPEQLASLGDQALRVLDGDGHSRFSIIIAPGQSNIESHEIARQSMRTLEAQSGHRLSWIGVAESNSPSIDVEIIGGGTNGGERDASLPTDWQTGQSVSSKRSDLAHSVKSKGEAVESSKREDCRRMLTDFLGLDSDVSQEELNHRVASRARQLADDTTPKQLLEVFKRERLSSYLTERGLDPQGMTIEQMEHHVLHNEQEKNPQPVSDVEEDWLPDFMHEAETYYGLPAGSDLAELNGILLARDAAKVGLPVDTPKDVIDQALSNHYRARSDRDEYLRGIGLIEQANVEARANIRRDMLLDAGYPTGMANTEQELAILESLTHIEQAAQLGLPANADAATIAQALKARGGEGAAASSPSDPLITEQPNGRSEDRKQMRELLGLIESADNSEIDRASTATFGKCVASVEELASGKYRVLVE